MEIPQLNTEYDEGYFDKDEQGWVTNKTMVISNSKGVVKGELCISGSGAYELRAAAKTFASSWDW